MKLLYTVEEVFSTAGYLKEHTKEYYSIPLYQRGYKWTRKEVRMLLNDINSFKPSDNKFYCLQNITIVPNGNIFNVVDGQQRLTTLTLMLSFLGEAELVKDKIKFPNNSIRLETNEFINQIIINHKNEITESSWIEFIEEHQNFDHQDVFHLYNAYQEIVRWFNEIENRPSKADFVFKLKNNVKLIINKIDTKSEEEEIFGNLNSKRIPLDGADLFRAILITRVASEESKKDANIKDIIQLNEKRIKIGWEFDQINNWWSQEKVFNYFDRFVSIKSEVTSSDLKLFDIKKHPINLLLFLFAESENEKQLTLELIENYNNNATILYSKILKLHNTLVDWFEDREIYHYLGFLFANTKTLFKDKWDNWDKSETRNDFKDLLKKDIKKIIYDTEIDFTNENIDWYNDENKLLVQVLILLDVIASLDNSQPFMNPIYFKKNSNDIEHIFPQNPADVKEKKEFIQFLNNRIVVDKFDLSDYDKKKDTDAYKLKVETFIQKHIKSIKINSIGNLVLLYYSLNRSIGRISYAKKRSRVIDHFNQGKYIQPHTFRVFVRYFNDGITEIQELEHWTNLDIESNAKAVDNKIKDFFKNK